MSTTLPTDLSARLAPVEIRGVLWRPRLIPAGKLIELRGAMLTAYDPIAKADESEKHQAVRQAEPALVQAYGAIVAWGLEAVESPKGPAALPRVRASYDGEPYEVVAPEWVDRLLHVENGTLGTDVALAILRANDLTADEVLGFA